MQVAAAAQRIQVQIHRVWSAILAWITPRLMHFRRVLCALWQSLVPPALEGPSSRQLQSLYDSDVTTQQAEQLMALRQRFRGRPEYAEMEINERRLQFARWLVEHGHLAEFPPHGIATPPRRRPREHHEHDELAARSNRVPCPDT